MFAHAVDIFLFLYASWAFVRIGNLQTRIEKLGGTVDGELAEFWQAFTNYIKGGENHADKSKT
jgi:hypothetical protein